MTYKELLKRLQGVLLNIPKNSNQKIKHFRIDSREVGENDCFIALSGKNQDGHAYVSDAIKQKAACIIVEKDVPVSGNVAVIKVKSTLSALITLGTYFREKYHKIPLIAVTGSVGKTTTKELISSILETKYKVLKTSGNHNNHIGVPITLFELHKRYDMVVVEMGMNHAKEIDRLSHMCLPNIGVITNIGTSHIGNLGSQKNILKAKMEITSGMEDGLLLVNGDNYYLKKVKDKKHFQVFPCGLKRRNKLRATHIVETENDITFCVKVNHQKYKIKLLIPNRAFISNVLLAIKVGLLFSVDMETIIKVVEEYKSPDQRMNIISLNNGNILIDDCYNASYESVVASLSTIKRRKNKKIIILGDILELGDYSHCIHKKIQSKLKKIKDAEILLVGEETKVIDIHNCHHFESNQEMIEYIKKETFENTVILLKGSRRMGLEEIKEFLIEQKNS